MKITKTLSILSIIVCLIYVIGGIFLAVFPVEMCFLFGLESLLSLNPDYIFQTIIPRELPSEAITVSESAVPYACYIGMVFTIPVIISALLVIFRKGGKCPYLLSGASLIFSVVLQYLSYTPQEYAVSESAKYDFYALCSVWRFIWLIGLGGTALCVISALRQKPLSNRYIAATISAVCCVIYIITAVFMLISPDSAYYSFLLPAYIITAVIFIILNIPIFKGKGGRKTAVFAIILTAGFPLALQIFNMFFFGDYLWFMHANIKSNFHDIIIILWLAGGISCAAALMKGEDYDNAQIS